MGPRAGARGAAAPSEMPLPASTPNPDTRPAPESRYSLNNNSSRTFMTLTAPRPSRQ